MVEHVGKKRRKQVRAAINMKALVKKKFITCIVTLGVALLAVGLFSYVSLMGYFQMDKSIYTIVSLVIVLCFAIFIGKQSQALFRARSEYKMLISEFNITKEDMRKLEEGLL